MNIITCTGVEKKYDDRLIVKGMDLVVKKGETFGLLGPNGAGKSTTIAMLSSQLKPTAGTVHINGMDVLQETSKVKAIVGIVPQDIALYATLSAYDNLSFFGAMYGLKGKVLKEKINWILDLIGLLDRAKEPVKNYSGGMKRRINIAAALLHDPLVVFMDEPTVGIDPQSRNNIYELIAFLKKQGMTIIYTTHYMEEATALCDRVAIIDKGKVIAMDTVEGLVAEVHGGILSFTLGEPDARAEIEANITSLEGVVACRFNQTKLDVIVSDVQQAIQPVMNVFHSRSLHIEGINIMPPTLETLFLHLTGNALRD